MKVSTVVCVLSCFVANALGGGDIPKKDVSPAEKEQGREKRGGWGWDGGAMITSIGGYSAPALVASAPQIQYAPATAGIAYTTTAVQQPVVQTVAYQAAPARVVAPPPAVQTVAVAAAPVQTAYQTATRVVQPPPAIQTVAYQTATRVVQPPPAVQTVAVAAPARVAVAHQPVAVGNSYSLVYQTSPDSTYWLQQRHPYYYNYWNAPQGIGIAGIGAPYAGRPVFSSGWGK